MIKFTLKCARDHSFDSWFQSGDTFANQKAAGMVTCPVCGVDAVEKTVMAPRVATFKGKKAPQSKSAREMHALAAPASPAEAALKEMREKIQKHSEYVGTDFAAEARAIHDGDAPERSIYGEAEASEAKKLIEEGVPVAPLPFMPTRKTN